MPDDRVFAELRKGSGDQAVSTTMGFTRLLRNLARDENFGKYVVPIIPDEGRHVRHRLAVPAAQDLRLAGPEVRRRSPACCSATPSPRAARSSKEGVAAGSMSSSSPPARPTPPRHATVPVPRSIRCSGSNASGSHLAAADARTVGSCSGDRWSHDPVGAGLQHQDGPSLVLASTVHTYQAYDRRSPANLDDRPPACCDTAPSRTGRFDPTSSTPSPCTTRALRCRRCPTISNRRHVMRRHCPRCATARKARRDVALLFSHTAARTALTPRRTSPTTRHRCRLRRPRRTSTARRDAQSSGGPAAPGPERRSPFVATATRDRRPSFAHRRREDRADRSPDSSDRLLFARLRRADGIGRSTPARRATSRPIRRPFRRRRRAVRRWPHQAWSGPADREGDHRLRHRYPTARSSILHEGEGHQPLPLGPPPSWRSGRAAKPARPPLRTEIPHSGQCGSRHTGGSRPTARPRTLVTLSRPLGAELARRPRHHCVSSSWYTPSVLEPFVIGVRTGTRSGKGRASVSRRRASIRR